MTTTPQAALLRDQQQRNELHALIRGFGYTTNSQTQELVTAILDKLQSTQADPAQSGELPGEREAFEAWASDNGEFPRAIARSGEVYHLMQTQVYWLAWQARAALSARKPAVPLTDDRICEEWFDVYALELSNLDKARLLARAIERAHGIGLEVKPSTTAGEQP